MSYIYIQPSYKCVNCNNECEIRNFIVRTPAGMCLFAYAKNHKFKRKIIFEDESLRLKLHISNGIVVALGNSSIGN